MIENDLLTNLKIEIKMAGGRNHLCYLIMTESPGWFPHKERQLIKERIQRQESTNRIRARRPVVLNYWSAEDILYVRQKFGKMRTYALARILGRTTNAIREKFYEQATPEEKQWVKENGKYAGRINNFKK
jgi:hypothetical protein